MLVTWIVNNYYVEIADVQTAFLYSTLDEDLYLTLPQGYHDYLKIKNINQNAGNYLRLNKSIYGLVQAARSWWKIFTNALTSQFGFEIFKNDNCLLKKTDRKSTRLNSSHYS